MGNQAGSRGNRDLNATASFLAKFTVTDDSTIRRAMEVIQANAREVVLCATAAIGYVDWSPMETFAVGCCPG